MTETIAEIRIAVARLTDHTVEVAIPPEAARVTGLEVQLVLDPARRYDLELKFWVSLVLPDGAVATAAPFYEVDGERVTGSWAHSDTADHEDGYGQVRGEQVFRDLTGVGTLPAGLLIEGTGRYTVGWVSAHAWDPALADHIVTGRVEVA